MALFAILFGMAACNEDKLVTEQDLPADAKSFLNDHFVNIDIVQVVKDREGLFNEYEVYLKNSTVLEFDRKGKIIRLKSMDGIPENALPPNVVIYVSENFPEQLITEWEMDDKHQEVELLNGIELRFNKNGEFIRMDT